MGFQHQDFNITNEEIDNRVFTVNDLAKRAIGSSDIGVMIAAQLQATVAVHDMLADSLKWMKERR